MKQVSKKKGFTIIEAVVATAILAIGMTGPMVVVYSAIKSANIAEDQIFAYYLAQEGVEYIRFVRDTNILQSPTPDPWLTHMDACLGGNTCDVDDVLRTATNPSAFDTCPSGTCSPVRFNGTYFDSSSGPGATRFSRSIQVTSISAYEAEITVRVDWSTRGDNYSYELRERMFDWSG